jgi:hypothetical protein
MKTICSRNMWPTNLQERTAQLVQWTVLRAELSGTAAATRPSTCINSCFHKQHSELSGYFKSIEFLERQEVPCTMQVVNWGTAYAMDKSRMRKQGRAHACDTDPNWPHVCFIYTRVQRPLLSSLLTDSPSTPSCRQLLSTCNRNGS